jgi:hypothetical protein
VRIDYTPHKDIDLIKWDECIQRSLNGIVYANSWYLNVVAGEWDALIADDYSIVFPLVKRKKFGIEYLYQPFFTQQLGIFSPNKIDSQTITSFINSIPPKFKYQVINFNTFNNLEKVNGDIKERVTYQLDLVQSYFSLSSKYSENTRRNISKSLAMGVTVNKMLSVADYLKFKKTNLVVPLKDYQLNMLNNLMICSFEKGVGEIYAAFSSQGELCASAFFVRSNGKAIYLSAASNELGKTNRAMFALVDQFINDYSESQIILDFEGSSIENIARFYAGFGAMRCTYQLFVQNKLPWFLKIFKR